MLKRTLIIMGRFITFGSPSRLCLGCVVYLDRLSILLPFTVEVHICLFKLVTFYPK